MLVFYLSMLETEEGRDKFTAIYEKYKNLMYYTAQNVLKDEHLAEDAVHNTFLKMLSIIDSIRTENDSELKGFIVLLTKNKAIDLIRSRKTHREIAEDEDTILLNAASAPSAEQVVLDMDGLNGLVECIQGLKDIYRIPLTLRAHGYKVKEIADILDLSEESVKQRLFRGRKVALQHLEEEHQ